MAFFLLSIIIPGFILNQSNGANNSFYQSYYPYWGLDHFSLVDNNGDEVQLRIDQSSGSGFKSRLKYESGMFHIRMKLPEQKTGGLVPNFYTISDFVPERDELDFEFMGTEGLLQTNIFTSGLGGREQRIQLWFDPSQDFHSYTILWNQHQIAFFVDDVPIRVFKNNTERGVKFPTKPMRLEATIWTADWAGQVNWTLAPFTVHYRDFGIDGCPAQSSPDAECFSSKYFWNKIENWELNPAQKQQLKSTINTYMKYDYCKANSSMNLYPECSISG